MQSMSIEQLRSANSLGKITGVTLKGDGGTFLVHIATLSGVSAILSKARSKEPRRFGNPLAALNLLREIGITGGRFDASEYDPSRKDNTTARRNGARASSNASETASYRSRLFLEIDASLNDPRPNLTHEQVMADMESDLLAVSHKKHS